MSPFQAYCMFHALKLHFTTPSYDYFRYNGKSNANKNAFERAKGKYLYDKLARLSDPEQYIVANFVRNNVSWIGDLFSDDAEAAYDHTKKVQQSLFYTFSMDLNSLEQNYDKNIRVPDGTYPWVIRQLIAGDVEPETVITLDRIGGYLKYWDKRISKFDSIVWPKIHMKLIKYSPFVEVDVEKSKKKLLDYFG